MRPPEQSSKAPAALPRPPLAGWALWVAAAALIWLARPVLASAAAPLFLTLLLVVALDPAVTWLGKRGLPGGRYAAAGLLDRKSVV